MKLFAKKPDDDAWRRDAPTAREIADGVRLTGAHQVAEHKLTALRDRRGPLREQFLVLGEQRDRAGASESTLARQFRALEAEERELNQAVIKAREACEPYRRERGARVEQALRPMRQAAAQRILDALAELDAGKDALNGIHAELRRAGEDAPTIRRLDAVEHLRSTCARIVN